VGVRYARFSLLDLDAFDPQELKGYYHEFEPYSANCRFLGCNHIGEPGCAVKQAVQAGGLSAQRHERYIQIYNELKEKWSRRYD
jgi:ribosome biogenesis GTPase